MNVEQTESTRKSQDSQYPSHSIGRPRIEDHNAFEVKREAKNWDVRLKHEFLIAWLPILHPTAYVVFTILEMKADWRPGPTHKQTRGYVTKRDIMRLARCSHKSVRRALRELEFWNVIRYMESDPEKRAQLGGPANIWLDEAIRPAVGSERLTEAQISALYSNVGAPTSDNDVKGLSGQNDPGSPGQNVPGTQGQNVPGTQGQNDPPQVLVTTNSVEKYQTTPPSSSSCNYGKGRKKTTTTRPDLSSLRQSAGFFVDDSACAAIWDACVRRIPDLTVDELASCFNAKGPQVKLAASTRNPVAVLIAAVPNAIHGGWVHSWRQAISDEKTRQAEIQSRQELELKAWEAYERGQGPSPLSGKWKTAYDLTHGARVNGKQ